LGMRKSDGNSYLYMLWDEFCAVSNLAYYFFIEPWDNLRKLALGLRPVHSPPLAPPKRGCSFPLLRPSCWLDAC